MTVETPLRRTPLYEEHKRRGGRIVPFAGWELPVQFAGISEEHRAVRTAAGVFDASHMGELRLEGERAAEVVNHVITGDVGRVVDGQALYTCAVDERGMILDDLIVYRAGPTRFLVVVNASNVAKLSAHFAAHAAEKCEFEDVSADTALLALQGPRALEVLALLGRDGADCASLPSFHFRDAVIANTPVSVARTGYTGEDGVEIFCKWGDAAQLYARILDAGRDLGAVPAGLGARDTLRLEARLSLYGNDIDETTNPLEAGLSWIVKLDKPAFVGRDALLALKAKGLSRKLVGFQMVGRGIARHGYPIKGADGAVIGVVTSGGPSPTLGTNIGLGYVPVASAGVGSKIFVDCRGKDVEAVVAQTPFYKRAPRT
ncbi:MAG: glycine cleavage system aminomethyltransferase GcvT [Polyangiaceae bacterium]|nr:glycine cleavage system aminomethyltransferase GcvT [Polyangiaceae bacterium]